MVLLAVGVAHVDHHPGADAGLFQQAAGVMHRGIVVVGLAAAATQDGVAVWIAGGLEDGGMALLGDGQEDVRPLGGADGIHRHLNVAIGAVLETHRAGQAGSQLTVNLALRGAGADGPPAHQIADILGGDGVQVFGARADAQVQDVAQQRAGDAQALVDVVGVVQIGVVDEALPADSGARLLEIHPHDQMQLLPVPLRLFPQPLGVFLGGLRIVDGAGADHHQQALIPALDDLADLLARVEHQRGALGGDGPLLEKLGRRRDFLHAGDAGVVGQVLHLAHSMKIPLAPAIAPVARGRQLWNAIRTALPDSAGRSILCSRGLQLGICRGARGAGERAKVAVLRCADGWKAKERLKEHAG